MRAFTHLKQHLAPPVFKDKAKSHRANLLNSIVLLLVMTLPIPVVTVIITSSQPSLGLAPITIALIIDIGILVLLRWGYVQLAGYLFVGVTWLIIAVTSFFFGGVGGSAFAFLLIPILMAGPLLGWRTAISLAGLSILTGLGLLYAEVAGFLPESVAADYAVNSWAIHTYLFVMATILVYVTTRSLNAALRSAQQAEETSKRFQDELELLVQKRTVDLQNSNEQLRQEIIEREKAEQELRGRERFLSLLNDITYTALKAPNFQEMLQTLADRLGELIEADGCYLTLWDETTQKARPAAASGNLRETYPSVQVEPGEVTMTESVLQSGQSLVAEDVFNTPYISPRIAALFPTRSLLGLPLIAGSQKLGAALIGFDKPHQFSPQEIAYCEQTAQQISLSIANSNALKSLRLSEERYRQIFETNQAVKIVIDPADGRIVAANQAACRFYGYPLDVLTTMQIMDINTLPPDEVRREMERAAQEECLYFNFRHRLASGEIRDVEVFSGPVKTEDGVLLYSIVHDISERKRAETMLHKRSYEIEQALRETQVLYRISSILAQTTNMQEGVEKVLGEYLCAINLQQGGISLFNPNRQSGKLYALYRHGQPQPIGLEINIVSRVYKELIKTKQPIAILDAWNDPLLADNRDLTRAHQIKSILFVPLLVRGEVIGVLGADSTESRRPFSSREISLGQSVADQIAGAVDKIRLDEEQRRLNAALEQATVGVIITDIQGNIIYVNPAFEQTSGYSQAEAIGQNPRLLKSGRHEATFYEELWATITAGQVWQGHIINRKKDGTPYTSEAIIGPVRDESGAIVNYVGIQRDITNELKLEERYRQAQKMEAVGRLAGGIAHDFNNILTVIIGNSELLLYQLEPDDPHHRDIGQINRSAERAASLTRQLLAFSRKLVFQLQTLNLNTIVSEMEKMLRRLIGEHIELVLTLDPELGLIEADSSQIEQVIMNLAINARDVMPDGGQLTIETAALPAKDMVDQTLTMSNDFVLLAVHDTGPGMSEAIHAHIFEPFFTTKEVGQGTGLGLATVHGIIEQCGGYIKVYSKLGQGTTFNIYLPQVE